MRTGTAPQELRSLLDFDDDYSLEAAKRQLIAVVAGGMAAVGAIMTPVLFVWSSAESGMPTAIPLSVAFFALAQLLALFLARREGLLVPAVLVCTWVMLVSCLTVAAIMADEPLFALPALMFTAVPVLLIAVILGRRWAFYSFGLAALGVAAIALRAGGAHPYEIAIPPAVMLAVITIIGLAGYGTEGRLWRRASAREAQLEAANADLARANAAKSEFLSNMSHELRTPLNSIIGFSGTLLGELAGPLNEEQRAQLMMVRSSGSHLLGMVNSLLDLSRIESGRIRVTPDDVDVAAVGARVTEMIRPLANEQGLKLELRAEDQIGTVCTDGTYLMQILLNLLANAVKFTPEGSVSLALSGVNGEVRFAVADTGRGIAAEEISRIVEPFYQVHPEDGGKSRGTGLGLSVSSQLAEALGGHIEIASEVGAGSEFTLVLPRDFAPA